MKSKTVITLLFALIIFVVIGVIFIVSTFSESDNEYPENVLKLEMGSETITVKDNVALNDLPIYQFSELSLYVGSRGLVLNTNSMGKSIDWFNDSAQKKVKNIQIIDTEHIGVVYKVIDGNYDETYMLVIFKKIVYEEVGKEVWEKTGEAYFFNELHSSSDYLQIKIGDSVDKLFDIDKSTKYDVLRKEVSPGVLPLIDEIGKTPCMIYKLLKDKIMTVEYDVESMSILDVNFVEYFDANTIDGVSVTSSEFLDFLS